MNFIVCEGDFDAYWYDEIIRHLFKKQPHTRYKRGSSNIMQKISESLRSYTFLSSAYDIAVFSDSGKPTIYRMLVPRMVRHIYGNIIFNGKKILVNIDSDGVGDERIEEVLIESIMERQIRGININSSNDEITIATDSSDGYSLSCEICSIPNSLEVQIVQYGIDNLGLKRIRGGIHDQFSNMASALGLSIEEMIRLSITNSWFEEQEWFKNIVGRISQLLS